MILKISWKEEQADGTMAQKFEGVMTEAEWKQVKEVTGAELGKISLLFTHALSDYFDRLDACIDTPSVVP